MEPITVAQLVMLLVVVLLPMLSLGNLAGQNGGAK